MGKIWEEDGVRILLKFLPEILTQGVPGGSVLRTLLSLLRAQVQALVGEPR